MTRKNTISLLFVLLFLGFAIPSVLGGATGEASLSFPAPSDYPGAMTWDGRWIWIADNGTHKLHALDPASGKTARTLNSPGYDTGGLAWDPEMKVIWCADGPAGWIYGLDPETGTAIKILETYSKNTAGLAFDGEFLWLLDSREEKILKLNRRDGMMHTAIEAPSENCSGLAFDGVGLWTSDFKDDVLYRIHPASGLTTTVVKSCGPCPQGVCWDGETLWNADFQEKIIRRLNLKSPEFFSRFDPQTIQWKIAQPFRNTGPGEIRDVDIYIAIPSSEENQELLSPLQFHPNPAETVTDRWGQKFARFHYNKIAAGVEVKPEICFTSRLYSTNRAIFPELVGKLSDIPSDLNHYLTDGFKYEINHPVIKKSLEEAIGDEQHPYWIMRKIFQYIIGKLEYNLKPLGGWNPASTVLERGTGSCSEYTFVFIALCRAAGLPARYAGSVVVRGEDRGIDRVWHRWAEVYLPGYGWMPVDVQAGDKRKPGRRAMCIGGLGNIFLITTHSGGDSEYLDFYYNFSAKWKAAGPCGVFTEGVGEYAPVIDKKK